METKSRAQVIVHIDDVGMCHGANLAFEELSMLGACTAGSVMVPCPWFLEAAEMAVNNRQLDLGVHLTLTSERQYYRWRPISTASKSSGLLDENGHMWGSVPLLRKHANVEAVECEMRAQVDAAMDAGIEVTHLDTHQGAGIVPEFLDCFLRVAADYQLPFLFPKKMELYDIRHNLGEVDAAYYEKKADELIKNKQLVFDRVFETVWTGKEAAVDIYQKMFLEAEKSSGYVFLALHPNAPGDIEVIDPEKAFIRTDEYALFRSEAFLTSLNARNMDCVGFRKLHQAMK